MSDKKSTVESIEDKIRRAAKEVEEFADKVSADEQPVVIVPDDASDKPPGKTGPK
jgi:hypothetical protein